MIDTKELRRLAQAATPGPWINHGRQPNVAGLSHFAVAAKTLLARVYSEAYGDVKQETANASFIAAANPAAITELLDRLEAAEKERDALRAKIEAAESDAAHLQALAESALRVAKGWEDKCNELRARIEHMEKQEPVASVRINGITGNPSVDFIPGHEHLHHGSRLYLAPGAQFEQKAVAYLDLGAGGYMDIGTDLNDEQLASLPKGRHMLGIVGTYGVDGYVSALPAPSIPEGWKLVPTAESRHPGIYKMLGALHAIDNTRGASEWESYAAMLAAAPEAKP